MPGNEKKKSRPKKKMTRGQARKGIKKEKDKGEQRGNEAPHQQAQKAG